ncbi:MULTISPECIES: glycosyltransferase family 4 protein [unclassified Blastococcus]
MDLFEGLNQRLNENGVELLVVTGAPRGAQAERRDAASAHPWQRNVPSWLLPLGKRSLTIRRLPRDLMRRADVLVAEFSIGSLDTWRLALDPRRARKLVLWGHVKAYVTQDLPIARAAKRFLGRRVAALFAYTQSGATFGADLGIDHGKFTVLNNSLRVDRGSRRIVTERAPARQSFLYLGALDESKRLDVLLDVADRVAARRDDFELVIAGDGEQRSWIATQAAMRPYVRVVGRVDGPQKAALADECVGMLIAGRVGLVVVESFGLGLPLVAPTWHRHAPEFDYLEDRRNAVIVDDSVEALADAVQKMMDDVGFRQRLVVGCREGAAKYSLEAMVDNFCHGLYRTGLLGMDPRRADASTRPHPRQRGGRHA